MKQQLENYFLKIIAQKTYVTKLGHIKPRRD
jgi:hypothetical protein